MDELDEEVYSTIFNALRHGVRRNILRMLDGRELTFTAIAENLNISSSHLTYHLDNLKELVNKTENGYQLSVFGEAAVEMTKTVETPPALEEQRNGRKLWIIITVLSLAFLFITGVTMDLYVRSSAQTEKLERLSDEMVIVSEQIGNQDVVDSLLESSSSAHLITGRELTYTYSVDQNPPIQKELDRIVMVFYALEDNLTLTLETALQIPDDFFVPLTVQKGNAFSKKVGTIELGDSSSGDWQAEVIWVYNVSSSHQTIKVPLPDEGWYTLSWIGSIALGESGDSVLDITWGSREMWTGVEEFKVWSYCQLMRQNDKVPFVVEAELGSGSNGISYLFNSFRIEN